MEKNKKEILVEISAQVIYYSLILIPFVASFSSAAVNVFTVMVIVVYLLKKFIAKDFKETLNPLSVAYLLLILAALLSFINTASVKESLHGIVKLLKYGFLFIIASEHLKDRKHLERIILASLSGVFLASFDGFFQIYSGKDIFRHNPPDFAIGLSRPKAAFPHTNIFAGYLALFLPLGMALSLYYFKGKSKLVLMFTTAFALLCQILTFSRGAIFGVFAAVLFMAALKKDKIILTLLVIALLITPFLLPQGVRDWVKSTKSVWELLLNSERIYLYKTSVNMISDHPVVGAGVNTFILNYQKYRPQQEYGYPGEGSHYAHNIYLHTAGEIGLLGLSAFLWLIFVLFRAWYGLHKSAKDDFLKICGLGLIGCIGAFLINGLTETNLYYPKIAILFWFQVGLLLGIIRLNGRLS
ncbi:MAG: O-antigen ligase family protein [Candidatus Omnitrophota bacterium]